MIIIIKGGSGCRWQPLPPPRLGRFWEIVASVLKVKRSSTKKQGLGELTQPGTAARLFGGARYGLLTVRSLIYCTCTGKPLILK